MASRLGFLIFVVGIFVAVASAVGSLALGLYLLVAEGQNDGWVLILAGAIFSVVLTMFSRGLLWIMAGE